MMVKNSRTSQGAITRIEVALGVLVFGVLAAIICPKVFARRPYAGLTTASLQIASFETALKIFQQDNGYFPKGTNALFELVRQPPGATNWRGPYLEGVPQDPWGRDYVYHCPGEHTNSGYPYDLICLGPPGQDSPVENWKVPQLRP